MKLNDQFNQTPFLVKSVELRQTKTNQNYLRLELADKNMTYPANVWDMNDTGDLEASQVVVATGKVIEFNNSPQLSLVGLPVIISNDDPGYEGYLQQVTAAAPEPVTDIREELKDYMQKLDPQSPITKVVGALLMKYMPQFLAWPAAKKNHHAYLHGLAFHTLSLLREEQFMLTQYHELAQQADQTLLYGATLIHDLGKVVEYTDALAPDTSNAGTLLGHISIVDGWITEECVRQAIPTSDPKILALRHLVLSHHGKLEWGSPVKPQLLEAEILHRADYNDANYEALRANLSLAAENDADSTGRIWSMDNRDFLRTSQL